MQVNYVPADHLAGEEGVRGEGEEEVVDIESREDETGVTLFEDTEGLEEGETTEKTQVTPQEGHLTRAELTTGGGSGSSGDGERAEEGVVEVVGEDGGPPSREAAPSTSSLTGSLMNGIYRILDDVTAAVNDGIRRAQAMVAEEMGKLTGGLGLKLPGFGS